jgi:hypothetical protein
LVERGPQSVNVKNAFATSSYLCYEAAITPSKGKGEENNKRKKKNRRIEVTNMAQIWQLGYIDPAQRSSSISSKKCKNAMILVVLELARLFSRPSFCW